MTELQKTIAYYQKSSGEDWHVAQKLFHGREYVYALFFCHLALEKLLKAIIVSKTHAAAPYLHHLARLAQLAGMSPDGKTEEVLIEITGFNIAGRYDDEKLSFKKRCTKPYAQKYLLITKKLLLWLKNDYLKKY